jgi:rubrerythrin
MNRIKTGTIVNLAEEEEAISAYKKLALIAKRQHLPAIQKKFLHIAKQEAHHKVELKEISTKMDRLLSKGK